MRGLKGKVAIVAGAVRLAEEGAAVVAADLNEAAAAAVVDEIKSSGRSALARSFDITDEASYKQLVDDTVNEFGRLDGLFNVAADLPPVALAQDSDVLSVSLEVWRHTIDVTLRLHVRHSPRAAHHDEAGQRCHR